MKIILVFLIVLLSFTVHAADHKPTPASKCAKPDKGCSSNTIDPICSKMACRAKGCNGDYRSGDCKTLKDFHKSSCEFASSKCGENLPKSIQPNKAILFQNEPMTMAPAQPLRKSTFETRKKRLLTDKMVNKWSADEPGSFVVSLTASECTWLGGKISHWSSCGSTSMKCTAANGREMCIDKVK